MQDDGMMPAPPYQLVTNEHGGSDLTDLAFASTRSAQVTAAARPELASKFLSERRPRLGRRIHQDVSDTERWASPLFLVGESYGTTRASGLSGLLVDRGVAFNGVLDLDDHEFPDSALRSGKRPAADPDPASYTATAWYHKKLPADLQRQPLRKVLDEAEKWAINEYQIALSRGDRLAGQERQKVIKQMARYTGLGETFIDNCDLRVELGKFNKELLREQKRTTGRLDSRFTGIDSRAAGDGPEFDPSMTAIRPPYTRRPQRLRAARTGFQERLGLSHPRRRFYRAVELERG